jgi:hypothetical protein
MTAAELRINNWYKNMSIDNPFNQIKYGHEIDYVAVYCEPIPLTEEWLLKFGFEKGNHNWFRLYFDYDNLADSDCFTYNINSKMLCLESFYDGEKKGSIQLLSLGEKHVHQLQNLYFALTNEELKISEL